MLLALGLLVGQPGAATATSPAWQGGTFDRAWSAPPDSTVQQPSPACNAALSGGRRAEFEAQLEFEEANVGPTGSRGAPRLCLLRFPREQVFNVVLTGIDGYEHFRTVKAAAIPRLQARGVDLCLIAQWVWSGHPDSAGYTLDDFFSVGTVCSPRVIAVDEGAETFLPSFRESLARVSEVIASEMNWRAEHPIVMLLMTDGAVAEDVFVRYRRVFDTVESAAQAARAGTSRSVWSQGPSSLYGQRSTINLVDPTYRSAATINQAAVAAYTYFAIYNIVGRDLGVTGDTPSVPIPFWLQNGIMRRQVYRLSINGANGGYLVEAARAVRDGTTPNVTGMTEEATYSATSRSVGSFVTAARSYGAVSYLFEQYGNDAVMQLLAASKNGNIGRFHELLQQLTGADVSEFDAAVSRWLLERPRVQAASADGRIKVEVLLHDDGRRGEAVVDEAVAACVFEEPGIAGEGTTPRPGLVGFSLALASDGSFTADRPGSRAGDRVTLSSRVADGRLEGTYRVGNEVTGCDGGTTPFASS